jgi:hypothetical protein
VVGDIAAVGVFSGAGLSHDDPAGLPLGFGLRNTVLVVCHEEALELVPSIVSEQNLAELKQTMCKLEVVLGRLQGVMGLAALGCLEALDLQLPNSGHLLAALHLLHGGLHVTLNFDEGIEIALSLLLGERSLPSDCPGEYAGALRAWQALVPSNAVAPPVVATAKEFCAWASGDQASGLLKLHGSIRSTPAGVLLADPVVIDDLELAQLSPHKLAAVNALGVRPRVLVTGYSGMDIDVYRPLLKALARTSVRWAAPSISPEVLDDLERLSDAEPWQNAEGYAETALARILGISDVPAWPQRRMAIAFKERLERWCDAMRAAPRGARAEAYAWLLADNGRFVEAGKILHVIIDQLGSEASPRLRNRLADVEYDRNLPGDKRRARKRWLELVLQRTTPSELRAYALTRIGETYRQEATRGTSGRVSAFTGAVIFPLLSLASTWLGRRNPVQAGRALSALSGLALRLVETMPPRTTTRRIAMRAMARLGAAAGDRALRLGPTGNRIVFVRQQNAELQSFLSILRRWPPSPTLIEELSDILAVYRSSGDQRGLANATAALAIAELSLDNIDQAAALLDRASQLYAEARPGQAPDPSGRALVERRRAYLAVIAAR